MRLGMDFPFPSVPPPTMPHGSQYPVLSSLICEKSQIEPLREGFTKDGGLVVTKCVQLWPLAAKMDDYDPNHGT